MERGYLANAKSEGPNEGIKGLKVSLSCPYMYQNMKNKLIKKGIRKTFFWMFDRIMTVGLTPHSQFLNELTLVFSPFFPVGIFSLSLYFLHRGKS